MINKSSIVLCLILLVGISGGLVALHPAGPGSVSAYAAAAQETAATEVPAAGWSAPDQVAALERAKETVPFVDAVKEHKPDILGLSALLTTTMPRMGEAINALKEAGIRDQVKIMVGGAPVTKEYAEKIGADAYGANAAMAVETGKSLLAG